MPDVETIFASPQPQADFKALRPRQPQSKIQLKEEPMVLDMGEASREQGFRLYGCR